MSQLESLIAAARDPGLHPGFVYDIVPTSSAIVDRKQGVPAYPTSATSLSHTGTRNCRIVIGSDGFCDASSVRLVYTLHNNDTTLRELSPKTGPWGAWSQVRLLSQGTEIERIDHYGRHHELFAWRLLPFQDQWAEAAVCGLHGSWALNGIQDLSGLTPKTGFVAAGQSVICMHKLHLSIFNSQKILPLRFCPLELDLLLAPAADWVDVVSVNGAGTNLYTSNFSLSNVHIIYDQILPDESIVSQFYSGLLRNQMMSVPVLCAYQFMQSIPNTATSVDITASRAFSKISSVWVTFSGDDYNINGDLTCPSTMTAGMGDEPRIDSGNPGWAPSVRLSIGGKHFPDPAPADNMPMQYYQMVKALGYSPNITRDLYYTDGYAVCFDLKRSPFDHGTGISSRSGDLIRIEVKNMSANRVGMAHVTIWAYACVAIRESAVTLLN